MSNLKKPRFHDEECFGLARPNNLQNMEVVSDDHFDKDASTCKALMQSAQDHFSKQNMKAAVDDIIAAYESLAQDRATLAALRNLAFRELSTPKGWQGAPHPQALRLRRQTPSIPLRAQE